LVETRIGHAKTQCKPAVAGYWRTFRPRHRHPQWPPWHHGRYRGAARPVFGNSAQFWLDLQGQYDIGMVEREKGVEIARRVRPADAA
jgi:hypothetical protein